MGSVGEIKRKELDISKQRQAGPTGDNMTSVLLCRGVAKVEGPSGWAEESGWKLRN